MVPHFNIDIFKFITNITFFSNFIVVFYEIYDDMNFPKKVSDTDK